ncbi:MAG: zf-HC2 domain-containing protein [Firmicutes bacterium]|nr:zf-HC2 domain-containing protein [Bacillota bacterium]
MNNCAIVRDLLPLYFDGETTEETSEFIRQHLEECPECREYFEKENRIPHVMESSEADGQYRYSVVAKRIAKRRNENLLLAGAAALAAGLVLGYTAGKTSK